MGIACNHSLDLTGLAGDERSPIHGLDPRAKIVGLIGVTTIAVSTPLRAWPVYVVALLVLIVVAAVGRVPFAVLWRRARIVLFPVALVALTVPFVRDGGAELRVGPLVLHEAGIAIAVVVGAKAIIGTSAAVLLGATTTFPSVLHGLTAMRLPRPLLLIAAFMYRYLFVVVEEVGRMRRALLARGYRPRHVFQTAAVGRIATALFLRSFDRGERIYLAMLARGYRGQMPSSATLALTRADTIFVALVLALPVVCRIGLASTG